MQFKSTSFISILITLISLSQALKASSAEQVSFNLTVGVAMKRDGDSSLSLEKRDVLHSRTEVHLKRNPQTGHLIWPSLHEAVTMAKRDIPQAVRTSLHKRAESARRTLRVMITWYTGYDLLNPSCFPDSANWAPTDNSMVAAVTIHWPGKPECGAFVKVEHHSDKKKYVIVRVVDSCGGCKSGAPHLDLTRLAFEKLYNQDVGVVQNLKATIISSPIEEKFWTDKVVGLYGPRKTL